MILLLIHGTFAGHPATIGEKLKWWQGGSEFRSDFIASLQEPNVTLEEFIWDIDHQDGTNFAGRNTTKARTDGATHLAEYIQTLSEKGEKIILIGHSHGGSVIEETLQQLKNDPETLSIIQRVVTVGTPFISLRKKTAAQRYWPFWVPVVLTIGLMTGLFSNPLIMASVIMPVILFASSSEPSKVMIYLSKLAGSFVIGLLIFVLPYLVIFYGAALIYLTIYGFGGSENDAGIFFIIGILCLGYLFLSWKWSLKQFKKTKNYFLNLYDIDRRDGSRPFPAEKFISLAHGSDEAIAALRGAVYTKVPIAPEKPLKGLEFLTSISLALIVSWFFMYGIPDMRIDAQKDLEDSVTPEVFVRDLGMIPSSLLSNFSQDEEAIKVIKNMLDARDQNMAAIFGVGSVEDQLLNWLSPLFSSLEENPDALLEAALSCKAPLDEAIEFVKPNLLNAILQVGMGGNLTEYCQVDFLSAEIDKFDTAEISNFFNDDVERKDVLQNLLRFDAVEELDGHIFSTRSNGNNGSNDIFRLEPGETIGSNALLVQGAEQATKRKYIKLLEAKVLTLAKEIFETRSPQVNTPSNEEDILAEEFIVEVIEKFFESDTNVADAFVDAASNCTVRTVGNTRTPMKETEPNLDGNSAEIDFVAQAGVFIFARDFSYCNSDLDQSLIDPLVAFVPANRIYENHYVPTEYCRKSIYYNLDIFRSVLVGESLEDWRAVNRAVDSFCPPVKLRDNDVSVMGWPMKGDMPSWSEKFSNWATDKRSSQSALDKLLAIPLDFGLVPLLLFIGLIFAVASVVRIVFSYILGPLAKLIIDRAGQTGIRNSTFGLSEDQSVIDVSHNSPWIFANEEGWKKINAEDKYIDHNKKRLLPADKCLIAESLKLESDVALGNRSFQTRKIVTEQLGNSQEIKGMVEMIGKTFTWEELIHTHYFNSSDFRALIIHMTMNDLFGVKWTEDFLTRIQQLKVEELISTIKPQGKAKVKRE